MKFFVRERVSKREKHMVFILVNRFKISSLFKYKVKLDALACNSEKTPNVSCKALIKQYTIT